MTPPVDPDHLARAAAQPAFDAVTLRDYFAAAALQGILAAHSGEVQLPDDDQAARWSYAAADAMLARRAGSTV